MDIEKLFAEARRSPVSALRLGILIKDGEIELPVGQMLEAFALVFRQYEAYRREFDEVRDDFVRAEASRWVNAFNPVLEAFHDIFFDFETEIVCWLKNMKKSDISREQQDVVALFLGQCSRDENLSPALRHFALVK